MYAFLIDGNKRVISYQPRQIELREEARPLTLEEKLDSVDKKADAAMEAIAEVYEGK